MSDRTERAARLADALLADANREPTESKSTTTCEACGRGMIDHGRRGCSPRCEQWLVDGNPAPDPGFARKALDTPIRGWAVIAGPPGVEIGSRPYAELLDGIAEKRGHKGGKRAPPKNGANPEEIEGADRARSPRISRGAREPQQQPPRHRRLCGRPCRRARRPQGPRRGWVCPARSGMDPARIAGRGHQLRRQVAGDARNCTAEHSAVPHLRLSQSCRSVSLLLASLPHCR
jgi:hypothetical protein